MTAEPTLLQRFGLTVTPQNVLGVRAVVVQEAQDLDKMLRTEREPVALPPLGGDQVSDMSGTSNEATEQLLTPAQAHSDSLSEEYGGVAVAAPFAPRARAKPVRDGARPERRVRAGRWSVRVRR